VDGLHVVMFCAAVGAAAFGVLAEAGPRPAGAPKLSDVCFSSRWRHPANDEDPHDTFAAAAAFHATRLDWVYSSDPDWIAACHRRGYHFGGSLNSKLPDAPGVDTCLQGRIQNAAGELVTAPWMAGWNAWWGCVNSPEFRKTFIDHAKLLVQGGAEVLHVDDPGMNLAAVDWGGCYCEYCRQLAAEHGIDLAKDMREFQKASVHRFYGVVRREIDAYAGRHVPISSNNYAGRWTFPYYLFDYGMAELPESLADPKNIDQVLADARQRGKAQVFTFVSEDVDHTRRVIATTYACGGHTIVPWDVYLRSTPTGSDRYFGEPEEYADLYGFVRAIADYLNDYQPVTADDHAALTITAGSGQLHAWVRAVPGERDMPVVIHLVEWAEPTPAVIHIDTQLILGSDPQAVRCALAAPSAYDEAVHTQAEQTGDFSPLVEMTRLDAEANGCVLTIKVPALTPWGIVVLHSK